MRTGSVILFLLASLGAAEECPLHLAAAAGNLDLVRSLVAGGTAVDTRGEEGRTALHAAASRGRDAATRLLLRLGASVNAMDDFGRTPTDIAREAGNNAVSYILVEAGGVRTFLPLKALFEPGGSRWVAAASTLAEAGDSLLVPLLALAEGADDDFRRDRIASVLWARGPSAAAVLIPHLQSASPRVRYTILATLATWPRLDNDTRVDLPAAFARNRASPEALRKVAVMAWRHPRLVGHLKPDSQWAFSRQLASAIHSSGTPIREAAILVAASCSGFVRSDAPYFNPVDHALGDIVWEAGCPEGLKLLARWARACPTRGCLEVGNPYAAGDWASAPSGSEWWYTPLSRAITWLAAKQGPDGSWPTVSDRPRHAVGLTGLAMLAMLASVEDSPFEPTSPLAGPLVRGMTYLLCAQDAQGCIGARSSRYFLYGHAVATMALAACMIRGGPPGLREPVAKAVKFLQDARNPELGWGYEIKPRQCDTSITRWMYGALRMAWFAGVPIDGSAITGAKYWILSVFSPATGQVGYDVRGTTTARMKELQAIFPPEKSCALDAAGFTILLGDVRFPDIENRPFHDAIIPRCIKLLPSWRDGGAIDFCEWYWQSVALGAEYGPDTHEWDTALMISTAGRQLPDGSWPAEDAWSGEGGPVYATAMLALSMAAVGRRR